MASIGSKVNWQDMKYKQRVYMPNSLVQCVWCGCFFVPRDLHWTGSSQNSKLNLFKEHYTCKCISCGKSFKFDEVRRVMPNKFVASLLYTSTPFDMSESHTIE